MDVCAAAEVVLKPGETVIVPTGLKLAIPVGYEIQVRPRSGVSYKTPLRLSNSPGTIDSGYRDELGVILTNTSSRVEGDPEQCFDISTIGNRQGTYRIRKGDRILVKPGEKVGPDGVVVAGRSSLNEAMLTGESRPVEKGEVAIVIGGSINGEGALTVEVRKTGGETYLAQIIDLVRKAQESRSRSQDLANRAALWLTIIALTAGGVTLAGTGRSCTG
jgi:hypothetical protein